MTSYDPNKTPPEKDPKKSGPVWGFHLLVVSLAMLPAQLVLHQLQPPKPLPETSSSEVLLTKYGCRSCHSLNGRGGSQGPALDRVALRHDRAWFEAWLDDPQSLKPETVMPSFKEAILPEDRIRLIDFLMEQRGVKHPAKEKKPPPNLQGEPHE